MPDSIHLDPDAPNYLKVHFVYDGCDECLKARKMATKLRREERAATRIR